MGPVISRCTASRQRTRSRRNRVAGWLVAIALPLVLSACSDSTPSSSSGISSSGITSQSLVTPELRDLFIERAIARLRATGFTGTTSVLNNGKCRSGNRPGKTYRQEPAPNVSTASVSNITLYTGCFDVTISPTSNGSIVPVLDEPSEATPDPNVFNLKAYNSLDFSVSPSDGYKVAHVYINGKSVTLESDHQYRVSEITADQTVRIVFELIPVVINEESSDNEESSNDAVTTYTIAASVLAGGCAISPSGDVSVNEGSDQTFEITVDSGVVDLLDVDGTPEVCDQAGCSYSLTNVTSDHTIDVICN